MSGDNLLAKANKALREMQEGLGFRAKGGQEHLDNTGRPPATAHNNVMRNQI